ncbi:SNF2 family N-terminal domain-containing protein [Fomitopsis serialis]|uniref:SNF2 family N-terminal domain-containing protein n=1 Tax=Fomitopsis serialis TaxID=139415 RepID=UPI002008D98F|nr:SNF2 family N-terminal domain-containing protein [Neoantrodia serialis]KAH9915232.1 SNF2 family N-terminal domain-containing protein [Neoantrodia serialis]
MGLGKTLQTIAFHAFLRERSSLPFLVLCPLSVLNNWVEEFERFAPDIPVVMYHDSTQKMVFSEADMQAKTDRKATSLPPHQRTNFPVVITTYEMLMKDRAYLAEYYWGFIVVDEGHRLKNMNCRLIRELRMIPASSRMILTGTPLQNNLSELFALLNFVLPDMFSDPEAFEKWFNLPQLQANLSSSRSAQIIHSLHSILRPFLLRRLKVDVETNLPPKKEYVLYAPLSERQRELYDAIASGGLRALLTKEAAEKQGQSDDEEEVPLKAQAKGKGRAGLRRTKRKSYAVDGNDDEYFRKLEAGEIDDIRRREQEKSNEELAREWRRKALLSKVNRMSLQNMVMQLRKVCSHPFLFDWPIDPKTRQPVINDELSTASGKMMVLERLLVELFERGHKVLLFSQFTTMLDIIEDWATEFKGWSLCRIDGSTSMADRRDEVDRFQKSGDAPDAPRLFLLSTRAGGLGLNLVAADTVIFYDQDWNPQMDLQAQDRAHRIGQTNPKHTVETKIMQRANDKRKLEALVIAKGEFKDPTLAPSRNRKETMAAMAAALLKLEGEQIEVVPSTAAGKASVISDEELDVYMERGRGWTSAGSAEGKGGAARTAAFAVYEAPVTKGGDFLADMLGEEEEEEEEEEEGRA